MTANGSLDTSASREVVEEMVRTLGQDRAAEVLDVTPARFAAFLAGRGRLASLQINRITAMTRRSWMLWALDGTERRAKTPRQLEIVAANQIMRSCYEAGLETEIGRAEQALGLKPLAARKPERGRPPAARRIVAARRRATA